MFCELNARITESTFRFCELAVYELQTKYEWVDQLHVSHLCSWEFQNIHKKMPKDFFKKKSNTNIY